eukprot:CAMPEP_0174242204 /NCGR_PEP_ID=MMETSP0417-20130205/26811_1 /TAXON_ID=242541 /ORGANISM="Mayorella sp, Strain BSH-02190019" /LENGTH=237 /DNA_ID=CAMNT_0015321567 /DNA_START=98 /DNA_END=811 /DNA_ORIENTATION=+
MKYFASVPSVTRDQVAEQHVLLRSQKLRLAGSLISARGFEQRKQFFNNQKTGLFYSVEDTEEKPQTPGMEQMSGMMTRYMQMLGPQILQMAWISYFFSGFVLVKLPFPLTLNFRGTLQQGMELRTLDVRYVSSLSWYFLNSFGLRDILPFLLGEANSADDARIMQAQMGMGQMTQMAKVSTAKKFTAERESLSLVRHTKTTLQQAEQHVFSQSIRAPPQAASSRRSSAGPSHLKKEQ